MLDEIRAFFNCDRCGETFSLRLPNVSIYPNSLSTSTRDIFTGCLDYVGKRGFSTTSKPTVNGELTYCTSCSEIRKQNGQQ